MHLDVDYFLKSVVKKYILGKLNSRDIFFSIFISKSKKISNYFWFEKRENVRLRSVLDSNSTFVTLILNFLTKIREKTRVEPVNSNAVGIRNFKFFKQSLEFWIKNISENWRFWRNHIMIINRYWEMNFWKFSRTVLRLRNFQRWK